MFWRRSSSSHFSSPSGEPTSKTSAATTRALPQKTNRFSNLNARTIKLFFLLFALLSFAAQTARAYSPQFADEGRTVRLRWRNAAIPIAVSTSLLKQTLNLKTDGDALALVRRSCDAWEKAANVKFEIFATDKLSISPSGKSGDGVNLITAAQTAENLLLFGADAAEVSARTRTFYNAKGFIIEADIVLNPYQQFSTDGSLGTFDLEATLTHEIGHLLGLDHSMLPGATMFERLGKNGVYGLPNFAARTLAEDDIAGVRAIYGAGDAETDCCGAVAGKITFPNGKGVGRDAQIWAEEAETGRIAAAVSTNADGAFRIDGLTAGKYLIYAQGIAEKKNSLISAQTIGAVEVIRNKITNTARRLKSARKTFDAPLVGFNSQLAELAVPLNAGKTFTIYVGGKNLDADNFTINFNSPFFSFAPNSLARQDFGAETSVLSFEVRVKPDAPAGEYGFLVKSKNGETAYLVGALTVEDFANPWSVAAFSGGE